MNIKSNEEVLEEFGNVAPKDYHAFISRALTERTKAIREMVLKELKEQAEPYDGSKWHNQLSIETIEQVLNRVLPDKEVLDSND